MQFENLIFSISLDLSKVIGLDNFALFGKGHSCCPERCWSVWIRGSELMLDFGCEETISSTVLAQLQSSSSVVSVVSRGTFDLEIWLDGALRQVLLRRALPEDGLTYVGHCPCVVGLAECPSNLFDCSIGTVSSIFALPEPAVSYELEAAQDAADETAGEFNPEEQNGELN